MKIAHFSLLSSLLLLLLASILCWVSIKAGTSMNSRRHNARAMNSSVRLVNQEAQRQIGEYLLADASPEPGARRPQTGQESAGPTSAPTHHRWIHPAHAVARPVGWRISGIGKLAGNSQQLLQNAENYG